METSEEIKQLVKQKYTEIAVQDKVRNESSCCGSGCCTTEVYNIMTDNYDQVEGYNPNADLGLGCGLPTEFARIKKGDTIIDLGSGAGNDCFIARHETGEAGKVIGIDFTDAMIVKARGNVEKLGYNNIEFRKGEIENIPVGENIADVIISNCVLNLVPDKVQAFKEIFRVLKSGGHFSISDVVLTGTLPEELIAASEMYAGCISGAIQKEAYLEIINKLGFVNITIQKEKQIVIPDDILLAYMDIEQLDSFRRQAAGVYSITIYGEKATENCCDSNCCK